MVRNHTHAYTRGHTANTSARAHIFILTQQGEPSDLREQMVSLAINFQAFLPNSSTM